MIQATLASTTLTLSYIAYAAAWLLHFATLMVVRKWVRIAAVFATALACTAHGLGLVGVWSMRGLGRLGEQGQPLGIVVELDEAFATMPWHGLTEALGFFALLVVFGYLSLEKKFRLKSLGLFPVTFSLLMMSLVAIDQHRAHPASSLAGTWHTFVEVAHALSLLAVISAAGFGALLSVRPALSATVLDRVLYRVQIMALALLSFTLLAAVVEHRAGDHAMWPLPSNEQALVLAWCCAAASLWGRTRYAWAVRLATVFFLVAVAAIVFALFGSGVWPNLS